MRSLMEPTWPVSTMGSATAPMGSQEANHLIVESCLYADYNTIFTVFMDDTIAPILVVSNSM